MAHLFPRAQPTELGLVLAVAAVTTVTLAEDPVMCSDIGTHSPIGLTVDGRAAAGLAIVSFIHITIARASSALWDVRTRHSKALRLRACSLLMGRAKVASFVASWQ